MSGHGWLVIGIMELDINAQGSEFGLITYLESVNTLSLCVQVVSQIHNRLCLIILITNKVKIVTILSSIYFLVFNQTSGIGESCGYV